MRIEDSKLTSKTVLDSHGHIDVALDSGNLSVTCEIAVTTRVALMVGALTKCLAAGFGDAVKPVS